MRTTLLHALISTLFSASVIVPAFAQTEPTKQQQQMNKVSKDSKDSKVNKTKKVQKLTSGLDLQWMDTSVRPQDDFFRFMSGKWLDTVDIPADRGRFGSFDQLRDLSEKQIFAIIQDLTAQKTLKIGSNEQKIADLYRSFMDEKRIEEQDIKPLAGDFPL